MSSILCKTQGVGKTGRMFAYLNSDASVTFDLNCMQCNKRWKVVGPYTKEILAELKLCGEEFAEHEETCLKAETTNVSSN